MQRLWAVTFVLAGATGCGAAAPREGVVSPFAVGASAAQESPPTARAYAVVEFASEQVGRRYCWGGTGPSCFDCSGLVQRAWGSVGVRLPRTAGAMASVLDAVPLDQVRPGDVLWWPWHVGIYAGNGWMVDAEDTRHGVVRRPAKYPLRVLRPPFEPR